MPPEASFDSIEIKPTKEAYIHFTIDGAQYVLVDNNGIGVLVTFQYLLMQPHSLAGATPVQISESKNKTWAHIQQLQLEALLRAQQNYQTLAKQNPAFVPRLEKLQSVIRTYLSIEKRPPTNDEINQLGTWLNDNLPLHEFKMGIREEAVPEFNPMQPQSEEPSYEIRWEQGHLIGIGRPSHEPHTQIPEALGGIGRTLPITQQSRSRAYFTTHWDSIKLPTSAAFCGPALLKLLAEKKH